MKKRTIVYGPVIVFVISAVLLACIFSLWGEKIDDWQYEPGPSPMVLYHTAPMLMEGTIGLSAGGAKDINNFRENIKNNYLPLLTDITYEGLFYSYFFDTGEKEKCTELFCPSYSYAITEDPFSQKVEYYMAVGLNSGIRESDFERKKLNLVIVLDISGSMSSSFDEYYYDKFGNLMTIEPEDSGMSKMEIANHSVVSLLSHLTEEDRLGVVLYNDEGYLAKPLRSVSETDMEAIKNHILEINAGGGTYMSAGMEIATGLFEGLPVDEEYENRIIFLTDAMPNIGETKKEGLLGMTEKNAESHVYTTFIGIGVDFNTELVEYITKIRGANYYAVHSSKQFKERMDEEFEYMVTPLVFNLELMLESSGYEIEMVYGSPEADEATGQLMKVNTLFPSKKEEGETKGGLILLKLKKLSPDGQLMLRVTYEDRKGVIHTSEEPVVFQERDAEFFENSGIRKGVLLVRYANLMKNWINDERKSIQEGIPVEPSVNTEVGIVICVQLGEWERQSILLRVSEGYRELFETFKEYFIREMREIGDETLEQELQILDKLITHGYDIGQRHVCI
ncbi:MAG: VWA domain-containing protein [Theionarchaea archaeon]|nr:VWA domain-containing protein [Theionarchaea archaeon]